MQSTITSNDRYFGCPIIYVDTTHYAVFLHRQFKMFDTTKAIL